MIILIQFLVSIQLDCDESYLVYVFANNSIYLDEKVIRKKLSGMLTVCNKDLMDNKMKGNSYYANKIHVLLMAI